MSEGYGDELLALEERCQQADFGFRKCIETLQPILAAANKVGSSWSGSNLGYQSRVYFEGLSPPPPGSAFNMEVGLTGSWYDEIDSRWREMPFDAVQDYIYARAGNPHLDEVRENSAHLGRLFETSKSEAISLLTIADESGTDSFLAEIRRKIGELKVFSYDELGRSMIRSGQYVSRDYLAMSQGVMTAPHQSGLADMMSLTAASHALKSLAELSKQAGSHMSRLNRRARADQLVGTNIFIGHGRSKDWRVLKDFIKDRLALPYDEFNRVPVAGVTNVARLSQMLTDAAFALIVLTAEDEQADGTMHARMNVVHEVGLFQGKLGFTKAIVVLEDGCQEFSNIQGLGQIRYPAGKIEAAFEEIRMVFEREGLVQD